MARNSSRRRRKPQYMRLRERLNLPSTRMIDALVRKRRIPMIRFGHRTVRFELAKVEVALERLEKKAVGQP